MDRTSINPTDWGLRFNMDQAEMVKGGSRHLRFSGQVSVVADRKSAMGVQVVAPGEIRGQMQCVLANIDAILEEADMSRADIVALRFYTTDIDAFLKNYDVYAQWIDTAGIRPPQSLVGVQRLILPDLLVEIEAEAVA
jgi:enamine deaminase RidA (YjgF/YER057c/UK114 family)